ncbi:MAG: leukotoxin LktA family filamentous adhesin, partial [Anaerovibrio sp.]|nr:leukotoxin LktA family filamentous adhesin [Anaerovibrio sp.]
MAYVYNITKRNGKKPDITTREKGQRLVLASLAIAAGIFLYPLDVEATTITPKDAGDAAKIHQVDNVYNIDPQMVSGEFAYNRFSAFSLDAGSIANLKFDSASTLANLVNSQININGIVNAIKGGQIGGHLIFLSPDGIAVGSSGVINAGQFTGIVPNKVDFDK